MLSDVGQPLHAKGLTVHVAIADRWGAGYALARVDKTKTVIVPRGRHGTLRIRPCRSSGVANAVA